MKTNKFLALALMAVALVLASCSKDNGDDPVIPVDYSKAILGMWEGVSVTGDITYGNEEARIAYHTDGTYTYYKKYADIWFPSENVENLYTIDKSRITLRWRSDAESDFVSEWWNIDYIKDGIMKWSAKRERADGSTYTTIFQWKSVDVPMDEELLAKAQGDWNNVGTTFYFIKDGKLVGTKEEKPSGESSYSFYDGNKYRIIWSDDDEEPYVVIDGSCSIKGTTLTTVIEECIWPEAIGEVDISEFSIINNELMTFAFYEEGECYIADEDTPEYDHWIQLTRYKRK